MKALGRTHPIAEGSPASCESWTSGRCGFPTIPGTTCSRPSGNIAADPRVGLLFVDFDTGTTLQLTGKARVLWDRPDFAELKGAERAVEIQIGEIVETQGHGPLGWRFREYSPFNPRLER